MLSEKRGGSRLDIVFRFSVETVLTEALNLTASLPNIFFLPQTEVLSDEVAGNTKNPCAVY